MILPIYGDPKLTDTSFRHFLLADRRNRLLAGIAIAVIIVNLVIFKLIYPYMDITPDSESYLTAAAYHLQADLWPVGYSRILALQHSLIPSETGLMVFQYLCLQCGAFFLYFTLLYLLRPGKLFTHGAFIFLLINPLFLYLSNYVITEALFLALGFTWFALLLWVRHKPGTLVFLFHGVILAVTFTMRYNAMFFPVVALVAILPARVAIWEKVYAIALPVVLIASFIYYTTNQTYKLTGVKKFSVFSGWQLANNAMYMLPYIAYDTAGIPAQLQGLHRYSHQFVKSKYFNPEEATLPAGAYYMWTQNGPLKAMLSNYMKKHKVTDSFTGWARVSDLYREYGSILIKKHPLAFATHFWLPNVVEYMRPGTEMIGSSNRNKIGTPGVMQLWFRGTPLTINQRFPQLQPFLMTKYTFLFIFLQLAFIEEIIRFILLKRYKFVEVKFNHVMALIASFQVAHFIFSTLAAPVVLRYQSIMLVLLLFAVLLLVEKNENTPIWSDTAEPVPGT
ncbi:hypothetical protein [Chitinophaga sp. sic0106]|uniref:hypothetical protein n=1 Tax=Chitinophaga sp. sic0106 TaxID=2854785 RepID=UPI001C46578E|nr:hypothetical protein [Chitinophaga sp. sic0106]MBV7531814.1 hypothetical protein [Chitinophaga sp. sic0106]